MCVDQLALKRAEEQAESDEVYTPEFLDELKHYSERIVERNDYVNEFFLYFVVPQLEKNRQLKIKKNGSVSPTANFWDYSRSFAILVYLFFINLLYLLALPFFVLVKFKQENLT